MSMQTPQRPALPTAGDHASSAPRRLRSLVLAWHDEESGDELTVDVRGSDRFLEGLSPLGFVPVAEESERQGRRAKETQSEHNVHSLPGANGTQPTRSSASQPGAPARDRELGPGAKGSLAGKEHESAEHRVRWTVRLSRPWKHKSR